MQDVGKANTIDLWRRFRPTPSQEKFLRSPAFGRLFSSGYGSGKSMTGCREAIMWAARYPGCRGLIGRLVGDELKTTTMNTFWKSMDTIGFKGGTPEQVAAGRAHYTHNKSDRYIDFWNGSRIYYRHLDDTDSLGSLELNFAFIDEGAEVDDEIYKTISSSRLRWHLTACDQVDRVIEMIDRGATDEEIAAVDCDCPKGIWVCTNPGASGYLKSVTEGRVPRWDWIPAKPGDNPYNGPEYYAQMEQDRQINGEIWMKRFYEGSWDAFEGQRFPGFDREKHVVNKDFRPTDRHLNICGWDFGHVETFIAFISWMPDGSEPVVVYDEVVVNNVNDPKDVADLVNERIKEYGLRNVIHLGDPAGVGSTQFSNETPIGAYASHGLHISPAKKAKSPTGRADHLSKFLNIRIKTFDGTEWPGIVFIDGKTPRAVDSIIGLRWKPKTGKAGEDPREVFLDKNKHGFDGVTYGLHGVPPPELPKPKPQTTVRVNVTAAEAMRQSGG